MVGKRAEPFLLAKGGERQRVKKGRGKLGEVKFKPLFKRLVNADDEHSRFLLKVSKSSPIEYNQLKACARPLYHSLFFLFLFIFCFLNDESIL